MLLLCMLHAHRSVSTCPELVKLLGEFKIELYIDLRILDTDGLPERMQDG